VRETRPRGYERSSAVRAARPREQPLDDWLGDISDDDWSEKATERAERRGATPAYEELPVPEGDVWPGLTADRPPPARPLAAAESHRAVIERRRLVAVLGLMVVLGLAVVLAAPLVRGGGQTPVTPVPAPATRTTALGGSGPSSAPATPSTSPSTTTPTTPQSTPGDSTFTLPEGTKLRRGEGDYPALIEELQQTLSRAGYDPGPADGTYGRRTEAAVVAFQQANGLSVDGIVGPETASALNSAAADG
jgi:hypothetical protein